MSTELRELRARITVEADAALDAVAKGSGTDRSWALQQITIVRLLNSRLAAEGIGAASERHESGGGRR